MDPIEESDEYIRLAEEETSPLLPPDQAARLLGLYDVDKLEERRRSGKIAGESYRDVWWAWWRPKKWQYRLSAIKDYFRQYAPEDNTPISRLANYLISRGIGLGASDIHIETDRRHIRVRLRINGLLQETDPIPKHIGIPLISHLYLMAEVPDPFNQKQFASGFFIADRGTDQGEGQSFLRLTSVPAYWGAKVALHILPVSSPTTLTELGMDEVLYRAHATELLNLRLPGLVLFAGPRGEGLTTTLRVALRQIEPSERNVYYLSDSPDFPPDSCTHIIYDREHDLGPSQAAKIAIRQNADLIAFGEIHDKETALAAIEATEIGLPVWAILPAPYFAMRVPQKDSAQILFTRFQGWGIPPERLKAVLRGAIQQRLLRTLCPDCREAIPFTNALPWYDQEKILPYIPDPLPQTVYRAGKCGFCRDTGYRGRRGLFTVYRPDRRLYDLPESFGEFAAHRFVSGEIDAAELYRSQFFR